MRSLKVIGVGFGITVIALCFAVNGYRNSLIEANQIRLVTPTGFSRLPALTGVSGYYTFIDDNHFLFSNVGSAKATPSGIWNVTDSRIHKITISEVSDKGCRLVQTPAIIVNLANSEISQPSLNLAKFVGFSRPYGGYAFPGENRNRVSGDCGSVIAVLDGASQLRPSKPEEKLGDIYWKVIGNFIDFNLKYVDSHLCVVIPKASNGKEYGTIEINQDESERL